MATETDETKTETQETTDKTEETTETVEDTKTQLAKMYLDFLDKQKWGIIATGAGLGVSLNPLQKDAIEYLTADTVIKEKKDIFSTFAKNLKKKLIEKFTWWTFVEYDKTSLNKMKALITANKDNQTKLQELMAQIEAGTDPTLATVDATTTTTTDKTTTPETDTKTEYQDPFDESVKDLSISSWFGLRTNPVTGEKNSTHYGIDLSATAWTAIHPIEAGKVTVNAWDKDAGNMITIESADGRTFSYLHMEEASTFKVGDEVKTTDTIGKVGSTGLSTWPHLHLAEKKDDKFVNPLTDEKIAPVFKEYKNYDTLADSDIKDQDDMKTAA